MSTSSYRADYQRVCVDCANYHQKVPFRTCTLPRNLVTGEPSPVPCAVARADKGHCGPSGRNYVPVTLIEGEVVHETVTKQKHKRKEATSGTQ